MATIDIILDGETKQISKHQLFALAKRGRITPETNLLVGGKLVTAGKVQGIVFKENQNVHTVAEAAPMPNPPEIFELAIPLEPPLPVTPPALKVPVPPPVCDDFAPPANETYLQKDRRLASYWKNMNPFLKVASISLPFFIMSAVLFISLKGQKSEDVSFRPTGLSLAENVVNSTQESIQEQHQEVIPEIENKKIVSTRITIPSRDSDKILRGWNKPTKFVNDRVTIDETIIERNILYSKAYNIDDKCLIQRQFEGETGHAPPEEYHCDNMFECLGIPELSPRLGLDSVSKDGKYLIFKCSDNIVRIIDWKESKISLLGNHDLPVLYVKISDNGKYVITASGHAIYDDLGWTARIWNVDTGNELWNLKGCQGYLSISPDSRFVILPNKNVPFVREIETGKEVLQLKENGEKSYFKEDGNVVVVPENIPDIVYVTHMSRYAVSKDNKIWDLITERPILEFDSEKIFFSENERQVASMTLDAKTCLVYDIESRKMICSLEPNFGEGKKIELMSVSNTGRIAALSGLTGTVQLYDTLTGKFIHAVRCPHSIINSLTFSKDDKTLIIGCYNDKAWIVSLSGLSAPAKLLELRSPKLHSFSIASQSNIPVGTSGIGLACIYNNELNVLTEIDGMAYHKGLFDKDRLILSKDGRHFVFPSGVVNLLRTWDTSTGNVAHLIDWKNDIEQVVGFSPDGKHIYFIDENDRKYSIVTYDFVKSNSIRTYPISGNPLQNFISDDGSKILLVYINTLELREIETGKQLWNMKKPDNVYYNGVRFGAGGSKVVITNLKYSDEGSYQAWVYDTESGSEIFHVDFTSRASRNFQAVLSQDEKSLAMTERNGISVWDIATGKETNTIDGYRAERKNRPAAWGLRHEVNCFSFSPNGRYIIACCPVFVDRWTTESNPVRIWDLSTGNEIWRLGGALNNPIVVGFLPDGKQVFVATEDGIVRTFALESEISVLKENVPKNQRKDENQLLEEEQNPEKRADIFDAAKHLDFPAIKSFLAQKPNLINARDEQGSSPLHCLFMMPFVFEDEKQIEIINYLIKQGAHIDSRDHVRQTPLLCAIRQKNSKAITCLLDNGADINIAGILGWTPLHYICMHYRSDECLAILQRIIDKGSDVNEKNEDGSTPLYYAAKDGFVTKEKSSVNIVKKLLQNGADVTIKCKHGGTALHGCKNPEIVQLLINRGADVNAKYDDGETPLHVIASPSVTASYRDNSDNIIDVVKILIKNGADVHARNKRGETAFDIAGRREQNKPDSFYAPYKIIQEILTEEMKENSK